MSPLSKVTMGKIDISGGAMAAPVDIDGLDVGIAVEADGTPNQFNTSISGIKVPQALFNDPQQVAILAPDVRAQKVKAFQAKEAAFKQKVEGRQSLIQGGVLKARQQVEAALGPILQGIMQERGANILLDRAAIVLGMVDIDVTQLTVQRLNQKLPTVKVQLVNAPAGAMQLH